MASCCEKGTVSEATGSGTAAAGADSALDDAHRILAALELIAERFNMTHRRNNISIEKK
jgi:hypothetical protein